MDCDRSVVVQDVVRVVCSRPCRCIILEMEMRDRCRQGRSEDVHAYQYRPKNCLRRHDSYRILLARSIYLHGAQNFDLVSSRQNCMLLPLATPTIKSLV